MSRTVTGPTHITDAQISPLLQLGRDIYGKPHDPSSKQTQGNVDNIKQPDQRHSVVLVPDEIPSPPCNSDDEQEGGAAERIEPQKFPPLRLR